MATFLPWLAAALWTGSAAFLLLHALRWQAALRALQRQALLQHLSPPGNQASEAGSSDTPWEINLLVAARDEALHLPALLQALRQQRLPGSVQLKLWLVDDGSQDGGVEALSHTSTSGGLELQVLRQDAKGKLAALSLGLETILRTTAIEDRARSLVLFTDADCQPGPRWAALHLEAHQRGAELACAHLQVEIRQTQHPASATPAGDLRAFENAVSSLQAALGCAVGRPPYVRGANWSVRLEALERAGALRGLEALPSGDDVHLVRRLWLHDAVSSFLLDPAAWVRTVESAEGLKQRAHRRYGKLRELAWPEQLRQGALFTALLLQVCFLLLGAFTGAWMAPLFSVLVNATIAHTVLWRGLGLLGENRLARRAILIAPALAAHALWHSLRGGMGGYVWKTVSRTAVERTA